LLESCSPGPALGPVGDRGSDELVRTGSRSRPLDHPGEHVGLPQNREHAVGGTGAVNRDRLNIDFDLPAIGIAPDPTE